MDEFEKYIKKFLDDKDTRSIENALKSMLRLIKNIKRNKDYKVVLYHTLMALSMFIDSDKTQRFRLKDLILNLVTNSNIKEIIIDLNSRIIENTEYKIEPFSLKNPVIVNSLVFESYLCCLKHNLKNLINGRMTDADIEGIKRQFDQLESLAKSERDSNKYYIGRSSGLAELVEYLFLTILESNKYSKDQQFQIMENRMRVVQNCSTPLLNCLKEALPYHAEPSLIKRYLKIVANLAYSIRETDSAKL
jgi:hypothetical protein